MATAGKYGSLICLGSGWESLKKISPVWLVLGGYCPLLPRLATFFGFIGFFADWNGREGGGEEVGCATNRFSSRFTCLPLLSLRAADAGQSGEIFFRLSQQFQSRARGLLPSPAVAALPSTSVIGQRPFCCLSHMQEEG